MQVISTSRDRKYLCINNLIPVSPKQRETHVNAESSGMQGTCPNAAQQVNCGAQTLDQLCPAPQTMMLPVPKRFLFLMRQRPIHPPQCPWVWANLPSPHILTDPQILNSHSQLTFTAKCQRLQAEGQEGGLTSAFRTSLWREIAHLLHRCF